MEGPPTTARKWDKYFFSFIVYTWGPHSVYCCSPSPLPLSTIQSFIQQILTALCEPGPACPGDALVSKTGS